MRRCYLLLLSIFVWSVTGCTLLQMRNEIPQIDQRIEYKKLNFQELERQNQEILEEKDRLSAEENRLISDLETHQLTLDESITRLDILRKENARIQATTIAQDRKKASLEKRLKQYQLEMQTLNQNVGISIAEKEQRKKELDDKIADELGKITQL